MAITWAGAAYDFIVDIDDATAPNGITRLQFRSRPSDVMRVERINKRPFIVPGQVPPFEDLLLVAYTAARRLGIVETTDFHGWAATVVDFGFASKDDEGYPGDPSQPAL